MAELFTKPYDPIFQPAINTMMERIQEEFQEAITTSHSTVIKDVYKQPDQVFWVATDADNRVAGTVGLKISEGYSEVKRMFVHPSFRGPKFPTASLLLKVAIDHARKIGSKKIFLGTMTQFNAAQRFYEKSGFTKINLDELPKNYKLNPMDSVFYKMEIRH